MTTCENYGSGTSPRNPCCGNIGAANCCSPFESGFSPSPPRVEYKDPTPQVTTRPQPKKLDKSKFEAVFALKQLQPPLSPKPPRVGKLQLPQVIPDVGKLQSSMAALSEIEPPPIASHLQRPAGPFKPAPPGGMLPVSRLPPALRERQKQQESPQKRSSLDKSPVVSKQEQSSSDAAATKLLPVLAFPKPKPPGRGKAMTAQVSEYDVDKPPSSPPMYVSESPTTQKRSSHYAAENISEPEPNVAASFLKTKNQPEERCPIMQLPTAKSKLADSYQSLKGQPGSTEFLDSAPPQKPKKLDMRKFEKTVGRKIAPPYDPLKRVQQTETSLEPESSQRTQDKAQSTPSPGKVSLEESPTPPKYDRQRSRAVFQSSERVTKTLNLSIPGKLDVSSFEKTVGRAIAPPWDPLSKKIKSKLSTTSDKVRYTSESTSLQHGQDDVVDSTQAMSYLGKSRRAYGSLQPLSTIAEREPFTLGTRCAESRETTGSEKFVRGVSSSFIQARGRPLPTLFETLSSDDGDTPTISQRPQRRSLQPPGSIRLPLLSERPGSMQLPSPSQPPGPKRLPSPLQSPGPMRLPSLSESPQPILFPSPRQNEKETESKPFSFLDSEGAEQTYEPPTVSTLTNVKRIKRPGTRPPTRKQFQTDAYVNSSSVSGLNQANYKTFIQKKDVALVMFYDPNNPQCEWPKTEFSRAAVDTVRANHGYAAVDCDQERDLCQSLKVTSVPAFKLYSGGAVVNDVTNMFGFDAEIMKKYVQQCPEVTGTVGPGVDLPEVKWSPT